MTAANEVWSSEITYIPTRPDFLYRVAIMDWHSRRVLSWRLSNMMDTDFCTVALQEALARHGTLEIFNTDQGSQFTSLTLAQMLPNADIRISMERKGPVDGQRLHRAAAAFVEMIMRIPASVRNRPGIPCRAAEVDWLLQYAAATLFVGRASSDDAYDKIGRIIGKREKLIFAANLSSQSGPPHIPNRPAAKALYLATAI